MSYQSLALAPRKRRRGLGEQEPGQTRDVHLGGAGDPIDPGVQFAHLDVTGCEAGAAEVGQQLELHDRRGGVPARGPAPGPAPLGDEPGVAKRPFEARRVRRPARDLQIDLHVHIGRPGVLECASRAKQFRNQPSEHDEFRPFPVVADDVQQRRFRRLPRRPRTGQRLSGHGRPLGDARRPPRRARPRCASPCTRGATERRAGRLGSRQAAWPSPWETGAG